MAELTPAEESKKRLSDVTARLVKKEAELAFNRSEEGKKLNSLLAATDKRLKQESAKVDTEEAILATKEAILATERDIDELSTQRGRKLIQLEKDLEKAQVKRAKREKKIGRDAGVVGKELLQSLNPLKGLGKALEGIVPKPLLLAGELLGKGIGAAARGMGSLAGKGIRAGGRGIMGVGRKTSADRGVEPETPEIIPETSAVGRRKTTKLDPKAFLLTSKTQPLYEDETPKAVPTEPAVGKKPGFFGRLFAEPEEAEKEKIIGKATVLEGTNELIKLAEERNKILTNIFNRLPKPADASVEREEDIEKEDGDIDVDVIVKKDKKKGWFANLLSGGMGKLVKWAAAFGAMLLPLIGFAAVAAILAAGGMMIHSWMTKKWGPGADPMFAADTEREIEFDKYMKDKTGGKQGFTEATAAIAGAIQDLPEVEEKLTEKGIKLQNDMMEELGQETSAGTLTVVRRSGELQEETQLVANKIFDEGIGNVIEKIKSGELGEKGLGEYEGILSKALAGLSGAVDAAGELIGVENITGFTELSNEEQVELLEMMQIQMATDNEKYQKTVDQMNTVALKTLQKGSKEEQALAVRIAEAQGEVIAKEIHKQKTTDKEEGRLKEIHERFKELAQLGKGRVHGADEEQTRFALEKMLETGQLTAEELGLLMKDENAFGLQNFSEDQRDLIGSMVIERGIDVSHTPDSVGGETIIGDPTKQAAADQKAVDIAENLLAITVAQNKIKEKELELEKARLLAAEGLTDISGNFEMVQTRIRNQVQEDEKFLTALEAELGEDHSNYEYNMKVEEEVNRRHDELKKKQLEGKSDEVIRLEDELKTLEADRKKLLKSKVVPTDTGTAFVPGARVVPSMDPDEFSQAVKPVTTEAKPVTTAVGTTPAVDAAVADPFTAEAKISWATGNMGTLYFNEAQIEKYKALELATKAVRREAEYIKRLAEKKLKQELTEEGVFSGSAFFMKDDDPRKAEMLAREKKIEEDAENTIQEAQDASLLFLNQMKRDKETQDKLRKSWEDRGKKKVEEVKPETTEAKPVTTAAGTTPDETFLGRAAAGVAAQERGLTNFKIEDVLDDFGDPSGKVRLVPTAVEEANPVMTAAGTSAETATQVAPTDDDDIDEDEMHPYEEAAQYKIAKYLDGKYKSGFARKDAKKRILNYLQQGWGLESPRLEELTKKVGFGDPALIKRSKMVRAALEKGILSSEVLPQWSGMTMTAGKGGKTYTEEDLLSAPTAAGIADDPVGDAAFQQLPVSTAVVPRENVAPTLTMQQQGQQDLLAGVVADRAAGPSQKVLAKQAMETGAYKDPIGWGDWKLDQEKFSQLSLDQMQAVIDRFGEDKFSEENQLIMQQELEAAQAQAASTSNLEKLVHFSVPHIKVQLLDPKEHGIVAATKSRRSFFQNATEADWQKTFGEAYQRNLEVSQESIENWKDYGFESKEEAIADARLATMDEIFGITMSAQDKLTTGTDAKGELTESMQSWIKITDALGNITQLFDSYTGADSGVLVQRKFGEMAAPMDEMSKYRAGAPKDLAATAAIIGRGASNSAPVVINNVTNSSPTSVSAPSSTMNMNIKAGVNDPHTGKQPNHMHNARRY